MKTSLGNPTRTRIHMENLKTCSSTPKTIKRAYRQLALQHHPDKNGENVNKSHTTRSFTPQISSLFCQHGLICDTCVLQSEKFMLAQEAWVPHSYASNKQRPLLARQKLWRFPVTTDPQLLYLIGHTWRSGKEKTLRRSVKSREAQTAGDCDLARSWPRWHGLHYCWKQW